MGGQGRVGEGQRVGGPAGLCAQGEQGEVPDQARLVGVGVEDGVVGLRGAEGGRELAAVLVLRLVDIWAGQWAGQVRAGQWMDGLTGIVTYAPPGRQLLVWMWLMLGGMVRR